MSESESKSESKRERVFTHGYMYIYKKIHTHNNTRTHVLTVSYVQIPWYSSVDWNAHTHFHILKSAYKHTLSHTNAKFHMPIR